MESLLDVVSSVLKYVSSSSSIFNLLVIVGMWVTFKKAGFPGWAVIVPFYNLYCMVKIGGKSLVFLFGFILTFIWVPFALLILYVSGSMNSVVAELAKMGIEGYGLLFMIPIIFVIWMIPLLIMSFMLNHAIAKVFGHGIGVSIGLTFMPFIFWPYLGFGSSVYGSPTLLSTDSQTSNVPSHNLQESVIQQSSADITAVEQPVVQQMNQLPVVENSEQSRQVVAA